MIYNYYTCNYCGDRCTDKNMVETKSGRKKIRKYYCDECVTAFKASCKPVKTIEINLPDELERQNEKCKI